MWATGGAVRPCLERQRHECLSLGPQAGRRHVLKVWACTRPALAASSVCTPDVAERDVSGLLTDLQVFTSNLVRTNPEHRSGQQADSGSLPLEPWHRGHSCGTGAVKQGCIWCNPALVGGHRVWWIRSRGLCRS